MKTVLSESKWRYAALFLPALVLRAVFLYQWSALPYLSALSSDAWAYDKQAMEILSGGLLRGAAFYQSPFYPYFLAAVYKAAGHHPAAVLWLQAAFDAGSCVLAMLLGERAFGRRAGLWAGLLCALYRPFIFAAAVPGKETLAVFSTLLFALLALKGAESGRGRDYFFCGLAGGWAALLRSNALLLPAALLFHVLLRCGAARARAAALPLLLGTGLAVLPATLHNLAASRDFVLINYNGGFTFFLGNNPSATGVGIYPAGFSSNPLLEESQPAALAELAAGRKLKPSEISRYWLRRGLSFIAAEPWRWLKLTAAKLYLFWNRYEIPDNYDLQFIGGNFRTLLSWPLVSFALAGCLGAAGLFLCRKDEASGLAGLLFLAYMFSLLPFWMADRYRLPAAALLLPLAAGALEHAAALLTAGKYAAAARPFLLAAPLMLLCLLPTPLDLRVAEGSGWSQLGLVWAENGDGKKASEAFLKAAEADPAAPSRTDAEAAARYLEERGDKAAASGLRAGYCGNGR
ncbi:MAG: glycosyltransferase family 39 protein [Elusimicrobia bacterium]|nr:glycosyltransferase family 39 protein [Elusimicrobiota bacterium]